MKQNSFTKELFFFLSYRYERFEVLAVFSSTVLVMFGGLFIVKERYILTMSLVVLYFHVYESNRCQLFLKLQVEISLFVVCNFS